jgi:hypothetical protein
MEPLWVTINVEMGGVGYGSEDCVWSLSKLK